MDIQAKLFMPVPIKKRKKDIEREIRSPFQSSYSKIFSKMATMTSGVPDQFIGSSSPGVLQGQPSMRSVPNNTEESLINDRLARSKATEITLLKQREIAEEKAEIMRSPVAYFERFLIANQSMIPKDVRVSRFKTADITKKSIKKLELSAPERVEMFSDLISLHGDMMTQFKEAIPTYRSDEKSKREEKGKSRVRSTPGIQQTTNNTVDFQNLERQQPSILDLLYGIGQTKNDNEASTSTLMDDEVD